MAMKNKIKHNKKRSQPLAVQNIRSGEIYKPTGTYKYIDGVKFTEVLTDKGTTRLLKSDSLREYWGGVVNS